MKRPRILVVDDDPGVRRLCADTLERLGKFDVQSEGSSERAAERLAKEQERFDLLLTPAAPERPYPVTVNFPSEINGRRFENYVDWIAPAFLVTLVSLPAGSVPAGLTRDRLPVGLQIVAPRFEEPTILAVGGLPCRGSSAERGRPRFQWPNDSTSLHARCAAQRSLTSAWSRSISCNSSRARSASVRTSSRSTEARISWARADSSCSSTCCTSSSGRTNPR